MATILLVPAAFGCASNSSEGRPAASPPPYSYANVAPLDPAEDATFVVLCFSGGGMRAAALAYGVLQELQQTAMTVSSARPSLLDEVDIISSVSGGSFTSAYYVSFRDSFFRDFPDVIKKNWAWRVLLSCLNPLHLLRMLSPRFSRTDVAAAVYSRQIFKDHTYDSLPRVRPFLIVNATDTSRGSRFEFTQTQFDPMCGDVGKLKVGKAVAASAAFPGLFPPLAIRSRAGTCGYELPAHLEQAQNRSTTEARLHQYATGVASYALKERRYIHLLDGGVADNIGARGLIDALFLNASPISLVSRLPQANGSGSIKKLVIILVNAKTAPDLRPDRRARPQSFLRVVPGVAFSTMANYSFETVTFLREIVDAKMALRGHTTKDVYVIEVGMDGIANADDHAFFSRVATTLHLPPGDIDRIVRIGGAVLRDNKNFQRLKRDLAASSESEAK
ncbi:MAG TPA: patatin-like phospholipase family protein [Thermoanaerobaculia bacterium]